MDKVKPFIDMIFTNGMQLIWLVLDLEYTKWLLGIVLTIEVGLITYKVVMWVLKKIPVLGIE